MSKIDIPSFQTPEHIGHRVNNALARAGKHWKSLTLTLAALGGLTTAAILMPRPSVDDAQVKESIKASDPYKAPETGLGQLVPIVTPVITEAIPTTAPSSPTPETQETSGSYSEPDPTKVVPDTKPTVAPAAATPEAQEDVPCVILPEKYCSQGEVVYIKNSLGETGAYIGFNLPVGTPIFAGKTGLALKAEIKQPHPLQGFLVSIRDSNGVTPNSTAVDAVGDLKLDNMLSLPADEGKPIATIQNTGVKVFGKFNFVTTISRLDPSLGRAVSALDLLKQLYPEAFAKPAINAESKTPDKSAPTVLSPMFVNSNASK